MLEYTWDTELSMSGWCVTLNGRRISKYYITKSEAEMHWIELEIKSEKLKESNKEPKKPGIISSLGLLDSL